MFKVIAMAVAIAATTTVAGAQGTSTYKSTVKPATQASTTAKRHRKMKKAETQADLQKEAKITEETARATALKEVPNGTVKSSELEREHGKLIYSFDITAPGKTGIDEELEQADTATQRHELDIDYVGVVETGKINDGHRCT